MRDQFGDAARKFGRSYRRVVARLASTGADPEKIERDLATIADVPGAVGDQIANAVARRKLGDSGDDPDAGGLEDMRRRVTEIKKDL